MILAGFMTYEKHLKEGTLSNRNIFIPATMGHRVIITKDILLWVHVRNTVKGKYGKELVMSKMNTNIKFKLISEKVW